MCNKTVYIQCSQSLDNWGLLNNSGSLYWSASGMFCGQYNSHAFNDGDTVYVSASRKMPRNAVEGYAKVCKDIYSSSYSGSWHSGSFTGSVVWTTSSCCKTASLVVPHINNTEGSWLLSASCGSSTSSCADAFVYATWNFD